MSIEIASARQPRIIPLTVRLRFFVAASAVAAYFPVAFGTLRMHVTTDDGPT